MHFSSQSTDEFLELQASDRKIDRVKVRVKNGRNFVKQIVDFGIEFLCAASRDEGAVEQRLKQQRNHLQADRSRVSGHVIENGGRQVDEKSRDVSCLSQSTSYRCSNR